MVPLGIPYSEFTSWDERDQQLALQWRREQGSKCPNCGTVPAEWIDEDGRYLEPPPYVEVTERCLGCETLAEMREKLPEDHKFLIGLRRNREGVIPQ